MPTQQPAGVSSPNDSDSASKPRKSGSQGSIESKHAGGPAPPLAPALAAEGSERMESALGDALLRLLRIRKGPKNGGLDLDAVCITISRLGQPFLWLTWILQDCNTTQYLGFRERRGVQSSLHPSAMGELFCFRPFIPLDVQGRERCKTQGRLEDNGKRTSAERKTKNQQQI